MTDNRVNWVDYGKGICIILVVMMHSTLNYGEMVHGTGWMHDVVAFAKPFRMPDFFLIAGLFLSRSINGPIRDYIDRKVIHFAYFYLLWLGLQTIAFEADLLLSDPAAVGMIFLKQLIFPASSLWFIHQLLVFYVVTRLLRQVPVLAVFFGAVLLHTAFYTGGIETGWSVTNRFANWYVYFFAGYAFAPLVFKFAGEVAKHFEAAIAALLAWAVWNGVVVSTGYSELPGISLVLGFAGAFAIVAVAALMARFDVGGFAATGIIPDIGTASLMVLIIAVAAPLVFHWVIKGTPLNVLYTRPAAFRLGKGKPSKPAAGSLAEPKLT